MDFDPDKILDSEPVNKPRHKLGQMPEFHEAIYKWAERHVQGDRRWTLKRYYKVLKEQAGLSVSFDAFNNYVRDVVLPKVEKELETKGTASDKKKRRS